MKRTTVLLSVVLLLAGLALYGWGRPLWHPVYVRVRGRRTVPDALAECRPAAETRLRAHFDRAGICYPPARVALLTFKAEKEMELWADSGGTWAQVRSYPIAAASGGAGPKLREGDRQVRILNDPLFLGFDQFMQFFQRIFGQSDFLDSPEQSA